jgi:hypothetical protein
LEVLICGCGILWVWDVLECWICGCLDVYEFLDFRRWRLEVLISGCGILWVWDVLECWICGCLDLFQFYNGDIVLMIVSTTGALYSSNLSKTSVQFIFPDLTDTQHWWNTYTLVFSSLGHSNS